MADVPRVIPCLLLDGDRLVKTRQFAEPDYVGDPVNVLSIFNSFEVDEIVLLDIAAARRRSPTPVDQLGQYATECFIPLAYGGGITDPVDADRILGAGFEKVVLNTAVAEHPEVVEELARRHGSQAVVASIDVRGATALDWQVHVRGGSVGADAGAVAWARRAESLGVGEILLTSVDREGTMSGFDLDLVRAVVDAVDVPVIAHGGAGRRNQLAAPVLEAGAAAVAAGSLFVYQRGRGGVLINYPPRQQIVRMMGGTRDG